MRFDPTQPYAEVIGIAGAKYEQNGRRFSPGGFEVLPDGRVVEDEPENAADEEAPEGEGFSGMHWRHLKAMVEAAGGEWTNKEDALRFLGAKE